MKKIFVKLLSFILLVSIFSFNIKNESYASSHTYISKKHAGIQANYIVINMKDKSIKPIAITAHNKLTATDTIANMAKSYGAFAAINGTYFEAYGKTYKYPTAYNTIIKDGELLRSSNGHPVARINSDGNLIIDRISFEFYGYINKEHRSIPWRINFPSTEADAITIFTSQYGATIDVVNGALAPIVENGIVTKIATSNFELPKNAFTIVYNPSVAHLVKERFKVGDSVSWDYKIKTTFTKPEDWKNVTTAFGAGPSLIINGNITADGAVEGFTEAKINTQASSRSFIGSTKEGKIYIGNFPSATLKNAAAACKDMGLINAMCLDGGGSVALYYNGAVKQSGRNLNNALSFVIVKQENK